MTGIWSNDGSGWKLLSAEGFPDEARLHGLVEEAPQLLPLAGSPQLVVVGREVQLGTGYADLLAIETTGRPAIIEVKLARNAEARRAIVSQVLAYAAYMHGMDIPTLEGAVLGRHLQSRGYDSLLDAVRKNDQEHALDEATFPGNLTANLSDGRFRLVLVLDDAPPELVRLVGYLEAVTDKILIDLIVVSAFEVGGAQVLLPQRVDAEPARHSVVSTPPNTASAGGQITDGAADFEAAIASASSSAQDDLRRYTKWAKQLEAEGLVKLQTYLSASQRTMTLLPRLRAQGVGLVTIYNDHGNAYLQLWRTVIERTAPSLVERIERSIAPTELRQGNSARGVSTEALAVFTEAYRIAAGGTGTTQ